MYGRRRRTYGRRRSPAPRYGRARRTRSRYGRSRRPSIRKRIGFRM